MCISASSNRDARFLCPDFIGGISIRKRNNRVVVHLNDTELSKLEQDTATAGICREKYIRLALMGITIHPRPPDSYKKVLLQLSAYGNNLNQISMKINAGAFQSYNFQEMIDLQRSIYEELYRISRGGDAVSQL